MQNSLFIRRLSVTLLAVVFSTHTFAEQVMVPPELLQQLTTLAQRVQQLEKRVVEQDQQLAAAQRSTAQPAVAQNADTQALEQRLLIMERKQEMMAYEKKKAPVILAGGEKGFGLQSADGDFELRFRGLIQADARSFDSTDSINDNFLMRRVRPTIEGKFNDIYETQ